jgi:phage recombination protein Bet
MSTDLTHTPSRAIERTTEAETLIREQFGLQEATTHEIEYLFAVANRLGLDPVSKQLYGIMRWDSRAKRNKLTVQVGIDGYRLAAARTGEYAGSDDAVFVEGAQYPTSATVTVYRIVQGHRCPFTATARWMEYVQTNKQGQPSGQWPRMPYVMLAKCAEALALRKAFPAELGGTYTDVEMQQSDGEFVDHGTLTDEQAATIRSLGEQAGLNPATLEVRIKNMRPAEYENAVAALKQRITEQAEVAVEVEDGAA